MSLGLPIQPNAPAVPPRGGGFHLSLTLKGRFFALRAGSVAKAYLPHGPMKNCGAWHRSAVLSETVVAEGVETRKQQAILTKSFATNSKATCSANPSLQKSFRKSCRSRRNGCFYATRKCRIFSAVR